MRFNKSSSAPYSGGNYGDHCKDGGRNRRTKLPSDPYLDFPRPRSGSTQPHPATIAEQRCPASDLVCASSFQLQPEKRPEKNSLLNSAPTHECPGYRLKDGSWSRPGQAGSEGASSIAVMSLCLFSVHPAPASQWQSSTPSPAKSPQCPWPQLAWTGGLPSLGSHRVGHD